MKDGINKTVRTNWAGKRKIEKCKTPEDTRDFSEVDDKLIGDDLDFKEAQQAEKVKANGLEKEENNY